MKLNINNFCVFRSPHCSHSNSCLNNLVSSTITTGLKAMTAPFLGSFVSKYLFPKLKYECLMIGWMHKFHFKWGYWPLWSTCALLYQAVWWRGFSTNQVLFFLLLGAVSWMNNAIVFSSWGLLIFKRETRKTIAILSLTLCIDILLRKYVYTQ